LDKLLAGSPPVEQQLAPPPSASAAVPPVPAPKDTLDAAAELFKAVFKGDILP
jgi:hypothetical protein